MRPGGGIIYCIIIIIILYNSPALLEHNDYTIGHARVRTTILLVVTEDVFERIVLLLYSEPHSTGKQVGCLIFEVFFRLVMNTSCSQRPGSQGVSPTRG